MTEAEWLSCTDPTPMLEFLRGKGSDRRLRLFACACARQIWHLLARAEWRPPPDDRSRRAVELAEAFIEGRASEADLRAAVGPAQAAHEDAYWAAGYPPTGKQFPVMVAAEYADAAVAEAVAEAVAQATVEENILMEKAGPSAPALRCIFNPFRPSPPLPAAVLAWNDSTVRRIAKGIYDERRMPERTLDTARLAILADALLDAGCDNEYLIAHCRSEGPHFRGCWAVDLILDKE